MRRRNGQGGATSHYLSPFSFAQNLERRMEIPKTLKIGGHVYDVIYPYHFTERGDRCGDHDKEAKRIRIDDRDSWSHQPRIESAVAATFLHEILHACDAITGHNVFEDEKVCEGTTEVLFQVLRDNALRFDEK